MSHGSLRKALGPGVLFAGAAIGVSHLVQSTRAGAVYGLGMVAVIVFANIVKYPAFSFGPRYAAATGTSLLEGYRRRGRWALVVYLVLTIGTMFTVQAAVTLLTVSLLRQLLGLQTHGLALAAAVWGLCGALLVVGRYRWLDRVSKVVVATMTVLTVVATISVLGRLDFAGSSWWPQSWDLRTLFFVAVLVGWMPSAIDVSVWHSLWTLARQDDVGQRPSVGHALLDFKIGYVATAALALCFVVLGAALVHGNLDAGGLPRSGGAFAGLIISLYTEALGEWSRVIIGTCSFLIMFSTTLTVVDGFPRALAAALSCLRGPQAPTETDAPSAPRERSAAYWLLLLVLAVGSAGLIQFFLRHLIHLIDVATTLSCLTAPLLAYLNHRAIFGAEVPIAARPGGKMRIFSLAAIVVLIALAVLWLYAWARLGGFSR